MREVYRDMQKEKRYYGNRLNKDRIEKLESIGFSWNGRSNKGSFQKKSSTSVGTAIGVNSTNPEDSLPPALTTTEDENPAAKSLGEAAELRANV